jgi:hypothetical protein
MSSSSPTQFYKVHGSIAQAENNSRYLTVVRLRYGCLFGPSSGYRGESSDWIHFPLTIKLERTERIVPVTAEIRFRRDRKRGLVRSISTIPKSSSTLTIDLLAEMTNVKLSSSLYSTEPRLKKHWASVAWLGLTAMPAVVQQVDGLRFPQSG